DQPYAGTHARAVVAADGGSGDRADGGADGGITDAGIAGRIRIDARMRVLTTLVVVVAELLEAHAGARQRSHARPAGRRRTACERNEEGGAERGPGKEGRLLHALIDPAAWV